MNDAAGTFEVKPMGSATPDGREIVYVAAPSLETVEAIKATDEANRELKRYDLTVAARIQALGAAVQLRPFDTPPAEATAEILKNARTFETFLLGTEDSRSLMKPMENR
jgi:hypothetical protein